MAHRKVRLLLLQARLSTDPMAAHEQRCFVEHSGLPPGNVVCHDLCQSAPTLAELERFDALTVGGSGDFYVSKGDLPHNEATLDLLREVAERGFPTIASCFGYQSMVRALGGEIIHDPANTEVGTYELKLSEAGRADPLFGQLPATFRAQMGHKDRAARHPDGIPNLASSERSPFQALRIPGKPVWASQFHPELSRETNLDRYRHYLEGYSVHMTSQEREAAFHRFQDSPETSKLLRSFLDLVFG